jgi:hypothetical protein
MIDIRGEWVSGWIRAARDSGAMPTLMKIGRDAQNIENMLPPPDAAAAVPRLIQRRTTRAPSAGADAEAS